MDSYDPKAWAVTSIQDDSTTLPMQTIAKNQNSGSKNMQPNRLVPIFRPYIVTNVNDVLRMIEKIDNGAGKSKSKTAGSSTVLQENTLGVISIAVEGSWKHPYRNLEPIFYG
ncbi:uncharacterized protein EAF02_008421 [Botrytis sinoallii]|uniref:uncharacterized protein n=1 Tax=Botrytis sinoallii TaxID=1463999 RepID=UPI00190036FF|nr:uncharacterized protein EAF02_008421 [Botrytis sinoallii]KAF7874444.1 hypothetical protein EAF02_008421 [Botrytis sinoallii]